jgi:ketosteroid isomerase-like protein
VAAGHDEIRVVLSSLVEMQPAFRTKVVKVVGTGHDLALVYNDWSMSVKRPDGTLRETSGKALEVVRHQPDGGWRVVIDDPFARG